MSWFALIFDRRHAALADTDQEPKPSLDVDGTSYCAADIRTLLVERDRVASEHAAEIVTYQKELYKATRMSAGTQSNYDCAEVTREIHVIHRDDPPCHLELWTCDLGHLHLMLLGHVDGTRGTASAIMVESDFVKMASRAKSGVDF